LSLAAQSRAGADRVFVLGAAGAGATFVAAVGASASLSFRTTLVAALAVVAGVAGSGTT
jgi:hypothetical protein